MARLIKRKIKTTTAEVFDENGNRVTSMEVQGAVSAPRMANIVRRDRGNTLLTVRNVEVNEDVYVMEEDKFMKHAERMGSVIVETDGEAVSE